MFTINDFLNTEGSILAVIDELLYTIEKIKSNDIDEESLVFNVYKVSINKRLSEVIITIDIFEDNEQVLKISIDDFYNELIRIRGEYSEG